MVLTDNTVQTVSTPPKGTEGQVSCATAVSAMDTGPQGRDDLHRVNYFVLTAIVMITTKDLLL